MLYMTKKIVFMDDEIARSVRVVQRVPEIPPTPASATVLIVTEQTWHLIRPGQRLHGDKGFAAMPDVDCTVIDVSAVPMENDEKMAEIIRDCTVDHAGVINMGGLMNGLCALGATVVPPPSTARVRSAQDGEGKE
jgi:hypothetical protein